jgi:hypothetical protein
MSAEKIVVQCHCGKKYKAAAAKIGKKMRCKACGEPFEIQPVDGAADDDGDEDEDQPEEQWQVEDDTAARAADDEMPAPADEPVPDPTDDEPEQDVVPPPPVLPTNRAKPLRLSEDQPRTNPDELMDEISKPVLGKTVMVSLALHALLLGITSIGFAIQWYNDYDEFGVMSLSEQREMRREAEEAAKKAEQEAERERKRQERLKAAEAEAKRQQEVAGSGGQQGGGGAGPADADGDGRVSDVERETSEVITEIPEEPSIPDLDADLEALED